MPDEPIRLSAASLQAEQDRFDRFRLIGWWDQSRLARAKVLVIGAGALGNELVKNLALLGVGNVLIADMDRIENSNLSRSILYRERHNGQTKASVAASAARDIYPEINVHSFCGNIVHDLGMGVFRWADIVLGGLDNREARLAINRNCWKVDRPWIDGAIEQIQGCMRFFRPDGPCYECTMSERDWEVLRQRRSCNLLSRGEMEHGRTPTTPTISSIIAGVQCQEAVKYLHGLPAMEGCGWIFEGLSGDSYRVDYQRKSDCCSHEMLEDVVSLPGGAAQLTAGETLQQARRLLGSGAVIEFARDMLDKFVCPSCGREEETRTSLGKLQLAHSYCPNCPDVRREAVTYYRVEGCESFLDQTLESLGVPPFDIILARTGDRLLGLELSTDAPRMLGELAGDEEAVEWT